MPRRAVTAFLARGAVGAGLAWAGATWARRCATRAFFVAVADTFWACSGIEVVILLVSPLAAVAALPETQTVAWS